MPLIVGIFIIKKLAVTNYMILMYFKVQTNRFMVSWIHVSLACAQNFVAGKLVSGAIQFEDLLNLR